VCVMSLEGRRVVLCRHGMRNASGGLNATGRRQSHLLGEQLKSANYDVSCIVTSTLPRAIETGDIVRRDALPRVAIYSDSDLDEQRFSQHESYWELCLRVQRVLTRALQAADSVVLVTHSGWIFACFRLMGALHPDAAFAPVGLATAHELIIQCHGASGVSRWFCESPDDYALALEGEIPRRISMVPRMWRDLPSKTFGESRIILETKAWVVRTDVWNMDKLKHLHSFEAGAEPLIAISAHTPFPLACMRDLRREHLGSLIEIDTLFPDEKWVKFLLYPPWAWQLHIHIHTKGHENWLPCRNVHSLKDVISMVQGGTALGGNMLVYGF